MCSPSGLKSEDVQRRDQKSSRDGLAKTLGKRIIKMQRRFATTLQTRFENLSNAFKWSLLIAFCLISTWYSSQLIFNVLFDSKEKDSKVIAVKLPGYIRWPGGQNFKDYIGFEEHRRVHQFLEHLDSLSHTKDGRKIRDSILLSQPGLMDNIHVIEEMFHSNSPKK